ncbi:glycosyltransferase family 4 protein [Microcoleus sp.]|uniref:glycosyltransferase family 4 protein n=1 Tax=Microcoleus sp. TaxID=44472 RepID=UPI0035260D6A
MKILLIHDYPTLGGGAELMMQTLRSGLRQRGHDARLFTSSARSLAGPSIADYECLGTTSSFRTLLQTFNPFAFWKLRQVLAEFQPDIVHVRIFLTQLSPSILPLLRDIPSIYHVAWYRPICPLGTKMLPDGTSCEFPVGGACYRQGCLPLQDWLPLMLQMKLWREWRDAFNLIVANSSAVKERLVAEGFESVEVVWNGIPIRPQRPPLTRPPTVVFAGRLVAEKGADVLLQAFAQVVRAIPEARLLIAGEGPERDRLTSLIAQLELKASVSLLGHLSRSEMDRQFANAWVQVVPSRWAEPFGIVAIEAMMSAIAVIASGAGGLAELVEPGKTGFLVPPNDVDGLAEALLNLLQNRELAETFGQAGRERALAHFSEVTFVDRFLTLYDQSLKTPR